MIRFEQPSLLLLTIVLMLLTGCNARKTISAPQHDPSKKENLHQCYLATYAADTGNLREGIRLYKKCIETGNLRKPSLARAHHSLGITYYELGEYKNAIKAFTMAISLDHEDKLSDYVDRGSAWSELKQYDKALQDYERALKIDPTAPKAYYNLGIVYERQGKIPEAKAAFLKAYDLGLRAPLLTDRLNNYGLTPSQ